MDNNDNRYRKIYLAGGCFWGTERFFSLVDGVTDTTAGYANSVTPHPTYAEVCSGATGAAETVEVYYDPSHVSLEELLRLYFTTIDPTAVNHQGGDRGEQYRTGIYYTDSADLPVIEAVCAEVARRYKQPLAVQVMPLDNFFVAEDYHQDYLAGNPGGYCHIAPGVMRLAREHVHHSPVSYSRPDPDELRRVLTPLQYAVTMESATEPPFTGQYYDNHERGIYVDITTGQPLFSSRSKFDSPCGWPSFSRPVSPTAVWTTRDRSHGLDRTEVRSSAGDAHLGHVFTDGPREAGGLRYCINSASLRFIPLERMAENGYADYIKDV